ncbi:hypothetical protein K469DRAFT_745399 [Zopfia rhizophila CBS 207.26]|uniref:Zn(2)-C6 fungal-type domain-containing protein n=1 Tax=Zopfia rhizophila CBS 207.26 TaxID=1314779 RepID=A0A6A6ENW7_9PEZI|nr:hypothetical protein K469DRAFT_745399 [Zopfia rhizophila CBS 207.26]
MRPKAQRSRACNQCRERRVKCDETPELCHQCRRLGLKCSGPLQGSVIIDMTDKVAKPLPRKKRDTRPSASVRKEVLKERIPKAHPAVAAPSVQESKRRDSSPEQVQLAIVPKPNLAVMSSSQLGDDVLNAIRWQYKLPMLYQPSQADIFDRAFISHFVELNKAVQSCPGKIPWITDLPNVHSNAIKPALRLSIRAASMAFYAQVHQDIAVLTDSYRWYIAGLNSQRKSLTNLDGNAIPNDVEVLVPIILGLYEVYAGTTPTSVFHHLAAATKILEMRGPRNCCSGVAYQLFKAMRVSDSHKSLIFNKPSVFSATEWLTLPFVIYPKNAHHLLTDIVLAIPECLTLCKISGNFSEFFLRDIPSGLDLNPARERANHLLRELDTWANCYPHLSSVSLFSRSVTLEPQQSSSLMVPDSFTALTAATYHTAYLTLTLLLHKLSPSMEAPVSPQDSNTRAESPVHLSLATPISNSASILQISDYIESTHPIGFNFLRSIFPLVVVAILGPREEQKKKAGEMLERWGQKRGVGGLVGPWIHI